MIIQNKSPNEILDILRLNNPELDSVISTCESVKVHYKGSVQLYQAACLYVLAKQYNDPDARILEIGTGKGYSTSYLASACPSAQIATLSISKEESEHAKNIVRNNLGFRNVNFKVVKSSWDYYREITDYKNEPLYDFVFVDGDHNRVSNDLAWWNQIRDNGLFVFHDYTPKETTVTRVLDRFKEQLGKEQFDVLIVDKDQIGMTGFYK
jgi:predicted O-methyltransferase YrrM